MKTPHQITVEQLPVSRLEPVWFTYISSSSIIAASKRLQIALGRYLFRVLHGQEIVYEGNDETKAIEAYNNISGEPKDQPKLDN